MPSVHVTLLLLLHLALLPPAGRCSHQKFSTVSKSPRATCLQDDAFIARNDVTRVRTFAFLPVGPNLPPCTGSNTWLPELVRDGERTSTLPLVLMTAFALPPLSHVPTLTRQRTNESGQCDRMRITCRSRVGTIAPVCAPSSCLHLLGLTSIPFRQPI